MWLWDKRENRGLKSYFTVGVWPFCSGCRIICPCRTQQEATLTVYSMHKKIRLALPFCSSSLLPISIRQYFSKLNPYFHGDWRVLFIFSLFFFFPIVFFISYRIGLPSLLSKATLDYQHYTQAQNMQKMLCTEFVRMCYTCYLWFDFVLCSVVFALTEVIWCWTATAFFKLLPLNDCNLFWPTLLTISLRAAALSLSWHHLEIIHFLLAWHFAVWMFVWSLSAALLLVQTLQLHAISA